MKFLGLAMSLTALCGELVSTFPIAPQKARVNGRILLTSCGGSYDKSTSIWDSLWRSRMEHEDYLDPKKVQAYINAFKHHKRNELFE
ncbi:hypothetical protein M7I_7256 [Glarea lozoyensis 74030]|nr:hypothetical protein M7I_7256 [Glarea lozoyensis 74030]